MLFLVDMDDRSLFTATVELVASTSRLMRREIELADAAARQGSRRNPAVMLALEHASKKAALLDAMCLIILHHPLR